MSLREQITAAVAACRDNPDLAADRIISLLETRAVSAREVLDQFCEDPCTVCGNPSSALLHLAHGPCFRHKHVTVRRYIVETDTECP